MNIHIVLPILALATFGASALAQDSGGLNLSPKIGRGPVGLARPLLSAPIPMATAQQVQNGMTSADHQTANQTMISALRGDPGYLSGFQIGTPLAVSRQQQLPQQNDGGYWARHGHRQAPQTVIVDNGGPLAVTVGNGNVVQQSSANGTGPIAQQQIVTAPNGSASGAANVVTGSGNIVQRTH